ncbi:hypothetical protein AL515_22265 [Citrobacter sp. FDAARGOS_156]|nr:hypothetical protein AL515_22265 [Citrobacter sp. FDAARGOS_156]RPH22756.1 hypothetical protein EHN13_19160 [Citrobacter youngae]
MLQNTPENKHLPGRHPHSDRKRLFAVCYCVITLRDASLRVTCARNGRSRLRHDRWLQTLPPD